MKKATSTILLTLLLGPIFAQVPVGAWRDHLPYSNCIKVVKIDKKIVVATENNLFSYNTSDNSFEKLSKITSLSDMGISTMEYNPEKKLLLVVYANGNIDIIKGNVINNIADIKKKVMTGSKKANHIFFLGNYAYLSYSFGIVVLDLERLEIKDTYMIGDAGSVYEVFSVVADNTTIYAATSKGIFKAELNDPFLVDYNRWHRITDIPNSTGKFDKMVMFQGKIITNYYGEADNTDALYYLENNTWKAFLPTIKTHKNELRVWGNWLTISGLNQGYIVNQNSDISKSFDNYGFDYAKPQSSLVDDEGNLWIADQRSGLVYQPVNSDKFSNMYPKGPGSNHVRDMLWQNGTLYVTGGGTDVSWNNLFNRGELFRFSNETWTNVRNENAFDYTALTPDPIDPAKIYVGSWGYGVFSYAGNDLAANYNSVNSSLQSIIPGDNYVRIGGMVSDDAKNIWITNSGVNSPLVVRKADGQWKSFQLGSYLNAPTIGNIHRDHNGKFWIILPRGYGIFVFDANGTIDNESDDRYLKFKPTCILNDGSGTIVVFNYIYCITSDNDGSVWLGTDQGVVMYSNPETVLDEGTTGIQPMISRNNGTNNVDPLLGTETVNCIAIDGANRKWFGTEKSGAYLFSSDGTKEIRHFNTDNSPIFSNSVKRIAIDGKSGEVFFGTDKGIISYRSNATLANDNFANVYVFPNPVREDYHGDITITGLIADCSVKITDISGNLVFETKSLGGQAVWDGKTGGDRRVATGVYLVFCSNDDGSKTFVTKVLVIH